MHGPGPQPLMCVCNDSLELLQCSSTLVKAWVALIASADAGSCAIAQHQSARHVSSAFTGQQLIH